jgi:hypothetical protein
MLRPTKYLDLKTCVLRLASLILSELSAPRALPLPELEARALNEAGDAARSNVVPALNMLFLLGRIDYDDDADEIMLLTGEAQFQ